jgi:amidase
MSGFAEYADYDGLGLAALVRNSDVSATELLDEAVARTEQHNGALNAVTYKLYDQAREAIVRGLPEGPYTGVPFLIKDLHLFMKGVVSSNGSNMFRDNVADHDSTLISRYREAGLVIFGKTNSPEWGLMPVTEPRAFGPSRNPWNTDCTPGGSSGGAGAAVAAGILPVAHASDGGGSIRIPASCCSLVGLKPSRGRTPMGPDKAEGWAGQSINHVVSRTVRDTAAMLDATSGSEIGEAYAAPHYAGSFLEAVSHAPGPLKIAVCHEKWGDGDFSEDVLAGLRHTVNLLETLGHHVEEARPGPEVESAGSASFSIISANVALAARQRAAELGCSVDDLQMEDGTRFFVELGNTVSAADYIEAVQGNQRAGRLMGEFHQRYDVLLTPTLASPPVPVGFISEAPQEDYVTRLFAFLGDTGIFNQTGQPSMSLPLHWSKDNLPVGMMFTSAYGEDARLLQLAGQLEEAQPWWDRRPPL